MTKTHPRKKSGSRADFVLAGVALLAAIVQVASRVGEVGEVDEYDTCMLRPGQTPNGSGWEPMQAVTHTEISGGLMGLPVARVVWRRRKPRAIEEDKEKTQPWASVFGRQEEKGQ